MTLIYVKKQAEATMETDVNRLMLEYERLLKETNRQYINPQIRELAIEELRPVAEMVARARAEYLRHLFELSEKYHEQDSLPCEEEMEQLAKLRSRFLDLVDGSQSFETAIQRGYLDLKSSA